MVADNYEYSDTAILIIDDFGDRDHTGEFSLRGSHPEQTTQEDDNLNCIVRPNGQGHYIIGGAGQGAGERPHGMMVYNEARKVLREKLGKSKGRPSYGYERFKLDWMRRIQEWEEGGARLLLVAIDTDGFTTRAIRDRTEEAMVRLGQEGIEAFVLNMSFAIIPCKYHRASVEELGSELTAAGLAQLAAEWQEDPERAKEELGKLLITCDGEPALRIGEEVRGRARLRASYPVADGRTPQEILEELYTNDFLAGDELRDWLVGRKFPSGRVIPVAASGNFGQAGYNYPFAPASFDEVVSIGAADEEGKEPLEEYSNPCEVVLDGRHQPPGGGRPARGTSFATPKFSALAGIYLLKGGDVPCNQTEGETVSPPLGYAGGTGEWKNLTLAEAIESFCPGFPNL